MPPFILEKIPYNPNDRRVKKILITKKTYSSDVKVGHWQNFQNSQPIDNNPYCPEGYNLHYSHYNRLGSNDIENWTTTTQDTLEQIYTDRKDSVLNPVKGLVNLHTSISDNCDEKPKICSAINGQDFTTTVQHSYQPPYPYILKRLAMPETPFYLNRPLSNRKECKFQDDDYISKIKRLQTLKGSRHVSYNPCTGCYTDGSAEILKGSKCVNLNY